MQACKTKRDIFLKKVQLAKVSFPSLNSSQVRAAASSTPNSDRHKASNLPSADKSNKAQKHPGDTQDIYRKPG